MLKTLQNFVKIGKNFKIPLYLELRSFKTPLYLVLSGPQNIGNMDKKNPDGEWMALSDEHTGNKNYRKSNE